MGKMGNKVVMGGVGQRYIENKKTGARTDIVQRNGVYEVHLWIQKSTGLNAVEGDDNQEEEVFRRQVEGLLRV